jgi:lipoprotein-anchoring transpeptidase ErfK/SrfK
MPLPATAEPAASTPTPEASEAQQPLVLNGDPAWQTAIQTPDGAWIGVVMSPELNIRAEPDLDAPIITTTFERHTLPVYAFTVNPNDGGHWYQIGDGRYVSAYYVAPFSAPAPPETFAGTWVDVNLSTFYAVAYDGETPIYAAIITAGRDEKTPHGVFHIFYRVRSETMDAGTLGVSKDSPEYYYLENVEYTQYFKDGGFAIHGNYWTPSSQFGQFSSNGCIGLMNADAAWFWNFLAEGSVVSIHD